MAARHVGSVGDIVEDGEDVETPLKVGDRVKATEYYRQSYRPDLWGKTLVVWKIYQGNHYLRFEDGCNADASPRRELLSYVGPGAVPTKGWTTEQLIDVIKESNWWQEATKYWADPSEVICCRADPGALSDYQEIHFGKLRRLITLLESGEIYGTPDRCAMCGASGASGRFWRQPDGSNHRFYAHFQCHPSRVMDRSPAAWDDVHRIRNGTCAAAIVRARALLWSQRSSGVAEAKAPVEKPKCNVKGCGRPGSTVVEANTLMCAEHSQEFIEWRASQRGVEHLTEELDRPYKPRYPKIIMTGDLFGDPWWLR